MKKRTFGTTLYCFSPPVMIATAVIELAFAVYSIWRYRKAKPHLLATLATFTLLFLALFQIAEYHICRGSVAQNLFWTKLGLVSITLLPPLGLHMVETITGTKRLWWLGYAVAVIYCVLFVVSQTIIQGGICGGNYVIIYTAPIAYGAYYFAFLFLAIGEAWHALRVKKVAEAAHQDSLRWLIVGYLSFMVPMAVVYLVAPMVQNAVPSIMCGFAILLAFVLILRTLPLYYSNGKTNR